MEGRVVVFWFSGKRQQPLKESSFAGAVIVNLIENGLFVTANTELD